MSHKIKKCCPGFGIIQQKEQSKAVIKEFINIRFETAACFIIVITAIRYILDSIGFLTQIFTSPDVKKQSECNQLFLYYITLDLIETNIY